MAKKWVLDTGTKGTGAHVVPLEDERERKDVKPEVVRAKRGANDSAATREGGRQAAQAADRAEAADRARARSRPQEEHG